MRVHFGQNWNLKISHKRGKALSIRVTHTIIALLKGLGYTLTFSIMHKKIIIGTKITISLTPIPLEVTIRNKLNGVEKAFEQDIRHYF